MICERVGGDVRIHPVGPLQAVCRLPGSKSLSNRALLCAALADGASVLRHASTADDVGAMCAGLRRLGVRVDFDAPAAVLNVQGCRGLLPAEAAEIDAGDAGTVMRFLTALSCVGYGEYRLDGSARMRQRPIGGLVDGLRGIGARIRYDGREGYPPLTVLGGGLAGGELNWPTLSSSQFLSAVLMVAPAAAQDVFIRIDGALPSRPYVDLTLNTMRCFGVDAIADGGRFIVPARQRYVATRYDVEPDASAATYFWSAAAISGGRIKVVGLTRASGQGDVAFVDVLRGMGCTVEADSEGMAVCAPASGRLAGVDVDLNDMPDTVQTLAVVALFAEGATTIRNVANLRIKETDRLAALETELARLGARATASADSLRIEPPDRPHGARVETYNDHRMAMSFALAGLRIPGIRIADAACVAKSFPTYWESLEQLGAGCAR